MLSAWGSCVGASNRLSVWCRDSGTSHRLIPETSIATLIKQRGGIPWETSAQFRDKHPYLYVGNSTSCVCVCLRTSAVQTWLFVWWNIKRRCFFPQGVIAELRVVGDPLAAERHCEEDEDDSDMVSDTWCYFGDVCARVCTLVFSCRKRRNHFIFGRNIIGDEIKPKSNLIDLGVSNHLMLLFTDGVVCFFKGQIAYSV